MSREWTGQVVSGAGGASRAFLHKDGQRIREICGALGVLMFPGSLNVRLDSPFDWTAPHKTVHLTDWIDRRRGFSGPQALRKCGFWSVEVEGVEAWAMRFAGESYPETFVELVAPVRLRDHIDGDRVRVCLR